ncbi:flagellin N-terminal helical domain-containing protein [Marinococcus luteus]|uniref:flagellin N-terminal helical domain-containing protein n=1 Tax=Marinococcus luteus TaxID=1122204 RepID=UPI002ACC59FA|nr:flagellin [Marinococcus luteus]MDZ5782126.1 flagellin [Marinococcus luteus]
MIINHNLGAMNAQRQMSTNQNNMSNSMEKLSSGLRINRAGDDAAGLAISEKMRGQIRGLEQADRNAQDGVSMIQTAEGALNETQDILQRMRELATQAANDTNTDTDRNEIQKEVNSLTSEINRIGNTTEFNTQKLLNGEKDGSEAIAAVAGEFTSTDDIGTEDVTIDGVNFTYVDSGATAADGEFSDAEGLAAAIDASDLGDKYTASHSTDKLVLTQEDGEESSTAPSGLDFETTTAGVEGKDAGSGNSAQFQIGANESQSLTLNIADMRASALGITSEGTGAELGVTDGTNNEVTEQALDLSTHEKASEAITKIQSAIDEVSGERSQLGANQNRLEHTINNLGTSAENLQSAESRIRDVDMAKEMMNMTKNNILSQASQSMLAQANQQPQSVLQLLQ